MVAINATIGMIQEGKAEKAAEAIKAMLSANADVVRGGKPSSIPAEQLVPGDVVMLTSGDKLPADVRIVECNNFQVCRVQHVDLVMSDPTALSTYCN